ncbi:MAG: hypothetical protein NT178_12110 [Proteobacteria bacterium]|nr:hypothetical protein [Pseudomonadota bacterium]
MRPGSRDAFSAVTIPVLITPVRKKQRKISIDANLVFLSMMTGIKQMDIKNKIDIIFRRKAYETSQYIPHMNDNTAIINNK